MEDPKQQPTGADSQSQSEESPGEEEAAQVEATPTKEQPGQAAPAEPEAARQGDLMERTDYSL